MKNDSRDAKYTAIFITLNPYKDKGDEGVEELYKVDGGSFYLYKHSWSDPTKVGEIKMLTDKEAKEICAVLMSDKAYEDRFGEPKP